MKVVLYSRWDGTQQEWTLDTERALDALGDLMMHGLNAREALQYMRQHGFDLAGQDFRVMGARELMQELRKQARELLDRYDMSTATDELENKLDELLGQEEETVREQHGFESRKLNDFLERRHTPSKSLSERIERFLDYEFENEEAADAYDELKQELENLKALEKFLEQFLEHFRGNTPADYDTAQRVRQQLEAAQQMMRALAEGNFEQIDPQQLAELLGQSASRSLIVLRDLESRLRDRGYLRTRDGADELTPAAVRRIGASALAQVYSSLRKGRQGSHETAAPGASLPRPDETRPYQFGDSLDIDVVKSVMNGLSRQAVQGERGSRLRLKLDDIEVREQDFSTQSTTVLLLDLSWSMSFENRFPAAKRVALAMHQLIRTQFPRDKFFVVGFSTRARELQLDELAAVTWDPSDPFTNLQEGLMVAERLISKHQSPSPQILVITDGQPTAYFIDGELHVEWPSGYGGISPRAVAQTLQQVTRVTKRGITINTFMLHDSPELVGFVERMTEINHGRALFTDPQKLGSYVLVDHLARRKQKR
ncbi:MAG TPA: VWA domain-containing protein [Polyangiales bacterium]|nr:VWA domain-containing protein [Polyangiales bacterium]